MQNPSQKGTQTSFGFKPIDPAMRNAAVKEVFASVAPSYDLMNDLMSLGIHRLWKRDFVREVNPKAGDVILDLAGGTGDIAFLMDERRGSAGDNAENKITICDINPAMLEVGKKRAMDRGFHSAIRWVEGNAEELPFADGEFDIVTIAFGLRNVTRLAQALGEAARVLKPGGRFYCLEFSHMAVPLLQKLYDRYSFSVLPWLGEKVAKDRASYQYLAESIRAFPEQPALAELMKNAGFSAVRYRNLGLGVAAIHSGIKA
jgi:demethylmenaquinone methyltransferase/2-methoxy-6-polyprenyl-1,4-benzoquinol methylase